MALENATTLFVSLLVLGIVGWGYLRARTYGQYGMVAWLQSIVLMVPWLLFFGLSALGIYLNFLVILVLFAVALGIYIYLGRKLRAMGQAQRDQMLQARLNKLNQTPEGTDESDERPETEAGTKKPAPSGIPVLHPIPEADLTQMQGIFGIDTFFCTETVPYQDGAIFRGNLRGEPRQVHTQLTGKLTDRLGDRYRLFLVEGPEAKPVVIVLPSNNGPKPQGMGQRLLAIVLSLATLVTVFERGELQYGFDLFENPAPPPTIIPLFLGLVLILLGHELGHLWMARRRQVRLSWPLFIPAWQLGSFGAITRFESVLPNRETLFDVALAGPAVGGILSFISLLLGLILPPGNLAVQVPTPLFQGSLLVGTLCPYPSGGSSRNHRLGSESPVYRRLVGLNYYGGEPHPRRPVGWGTDCPGHLWAAYG
jgi:hypothetical protein